MVLLPCKSHGQADLSNHWLTVPLYAATSQPVKPLAITESVAARSALDPQSSENSTALSVLLGRTRTMIMLIVRGQRASNLPATKPHIATASTVSLCCNLCAEQH
jgi:hypothetical protein